jgi:hypothetical protein
MLLKHIRRHANRAASLKLDRYACPPNFRHDAFVHAAATFAHVKFDRLIYRKRSGGHIPFRPNRVDLISESLNAVAKRLTIRFILRGLIKSIEGVVPAGR